MRFAVLTGKNLSSLTLTSCARRGLIEIRGALVADSFLSRAPFQLMHVLLIRIGTYICNVFRSHWPVDVCLKSHRK